MFHFLRGLLRRWTAIRVIGFRNKGQAQLCAETTLNCYNIVKDRVKKLLPSVFRTMHKHETNAMTVLSLLIY